MGLFECDQIEIGWSFKVTSPTVRRVRLSLLPRSTSQVRPWAEQRIGIQSGGGNPYVVGGSGLESPLDFALDLLTRVRGCVT